MLSLNFRLPCRRCNQRLNLLDGGERIRRRLRGKRRLLACDLDLSGGGNGSGPLNIGLRCRDDGLLLCNFALLDRNRGLLVRDHRLVARGLRLLKRDLDLHDRFADLSADGPGPAGQ